MPPRISQRTWSRRDQHSPEPVQPGTSAAGVTSGSASGVISSFPDDELTMIDSSGAVKAQPGSLSGSSSFTVTWERSS